MNTDLSPEKLLAAYAAGIFPMADEVGETHWLAPDPRAVLEISGLKVSRSLRTVIKRGMFEVTLNRDFDSVIHRCADRPEGTWISDEIKEAYTTGSHGIQRSGLPTNRYVLLTVTKAAPVISPGYTPGKTEEDMRTEWTAYWAGVQATNS